jgi:hypothetical protein
MSVTTCRPGMPPESGPTRRHRSSCNPCKQACNKQALATPAGPPSFVLFLFLFFIFYFGKPAGDILVSGSDDQAVILWDWQAGRQLLRYDSGHQNNVFQARLLPGLGDGTLVTCAADGQVRVRWNGCSAAAAHTLQQQHTQCSSSTRSAAAAHAVQLQHTQCSSSTRSAAEAPVHVPCQVWVVA